MTSASTRRPARPQGWASWSQLIMPLALMALGVYTLVGAVSINVPTSAGSLGPRAFPYAVGVLLVVAGAGVVLSVLTGHRGSAEDGEDVDISQPIAWATVLQLSGAFLALILLVEPLGWPIAATVLFTGVSVALGARPWWRAAVIGAVLALVIHVGFTRGLDLFLPAGPLEGVLGG